MSEHHAADDGLASAICHETPAIVLIVFNRPEIVERLVHRLASLRPPRLFVVGDGPRRNRPLDIARVTAVRELIAGIAWECDVVTNYAAENLGCRRRVVSGLNWVFTQVDEAIILEDDCLPTASFMRYTRELLARYREDERIGSVCGALSVPRIPAIDGDYFYSRYNLFTGWATWRRAWRLYDDEMTAVDDGRLRPILAATFEQARARWYWEYVLRRTHSGAINSWGYRWMLSCWQNSMLGIFPRKTVVENVGFGSDATNTRGQAWYFRQSIGELPSPLKHPQGVTRRADIDRMVEDARYSKSMTGRLRWAWEGVRGVNK